MYQQLSAASIIGEFRHEIKESHSRFHQKVSSDFESKTQRENQGGFSYRQCRGLAGRSAQRGVALAESNDFYQSLYSPFLAGHEVLQNPLASGRQFQARQPSHLFLQVLFARFRFQRQAIEFCFCMANTGHTAVVLVHARSGSSGTAFNSRVIVMFDCHSLYETWQAGCTNNPTQLTVVLVISFAGVSAVLTGAYPDLEKSWKLFPVEFSYFAHFILLPRNQRGF